MVGQVQVEGVFFVFQVFFEGQFFDFVVVGVDICFWFGEDFVEQVYVFVVVVVCGLFGGLDCFFYCCQQYGVVEVDSSLVGFQFVVVVWFQVIQCIGVDQCFQGVFVDVFQVDVVVEVEQGVEWFVFGVVFGDCFYWFFVDVFDCVQVIDDLVIVVDGEVEFGVVYVWCYDVQFYVLVFFDQCYYFVGVLYICGEYCGYEWCWEVGFQLGGLVGDQVVGC